MGESDDDHQAASSESHVSEASDMGSRSLSSRQGLSSVSGKPDHLKYPVDVPTKVISYADLNPSTASSSSDNRRMNHSASETSEVSISASRSFEASPSGKMGLKRADSRASFTTSSSNQRGDGLVRANLGSELRASDDLTQVFSSSETVTVSDKPRAIQASSTSLDSDRPTSLRRTRSIKASQSSVLPDSRDASSNEIIRRSTSSTDQSALEQKPPLARSKASLRASTASNLDVVPKSPKRMQTFDDLRSSTSGEYAVGKPPLPHSRSLALDGKGVEGPSTPSKLISKSASESVDLPPRSPSPQRRTRSASFDIRNGSDQLGSFDPERGRRLSSQQKQPGRQKVRLYVNTKRQEEHDRRSPVSMGGGRSPPRSPPPLPSTPSPRSRPPSAMGRGSPNGRRNSSPRGRRRGDEADEEGRTRSLSRTRGMRDEGERQANFITLKADDILQTTRTRTTSQTPSAVWSQTDNTDPDIDPFEDPQEQDPTLPQPEDEQDRKRSLIASLAPLRGVVTSPKHSHGASLQGSKGHLMGSGVLSSFGSLNGAKEEGLDGDPDPVAKAAEVNLAILDVGEPDIIFVDDGGRFRQKKKVIEENKDLEMNDTKFDLRLQALCDSVNTNTYHVLNALYGLHAGLCLMTLTIFPVLPLPAFTTRDPLALLAFYSPVAVPVSRLFSVTATGASIASIDWAAGFGEISAGLGTVGVGVGGDVEVRRRWWKGRRSWVEAAVRWWKRRSGRIKRVAAVLSVLLALSSFLSTVMMTYIDDNLFESQAGLFGGVYGQGDWFYNLSALTNETTIQIQTDLNRWQVLNACRGSTGIIGWGLYCLARRLGTRRRRGQNQQQQHHHHHHRQKVSFAANASTSSSPLRSGPEGPAVAGSPERYFVPLSGGPGTENDFHVDRGDKAADGGFMAGQRQSSNSLEEYRQASISSAGHGGYPPRKPSSSAGSPVPLPE
ncbi:hypothetical protein HDU67_000100 [Dinochytrium kinnereticum]|nr:hypothetical protein HDU67_000100 [Dinochytrium kinnereticum]